MNNQKNNLLRQTKNIRRDTERRMLPFAVEFFKFFLIFVVIISIALLTLRFAAAAL